MLSRFAQLFLLAALILLVPAGLYLSHGPEPLVRDPSTGSWYAANAPQTAQGNGPELPAAAGGLPGSTGQGVQGDPQSGAQGWKGALMGTVHKAGALWEQTWAGAAQQGQSPADRLAQEAQQFGLAQGKDATTDPEKGGAIMSKLGNATAKAELGRATWRFLHTMTLRFPEHPTPSEREALRSFMHLFSRLYPCGECASHFQSLLAELPPQTGSRKSASLWLCAAHNRVNARLGKEEFDCAHLDEKYDCGCGPEGNATSIANGSTATASVTQIDEAEQTHQPVRHKTALPPKGLAPRSSVEENGELGGYEALLSRGFDGQDVGSCACPA